ncbi:hypothetical protein E2P81_ATG03856 [Venturia nashicola]|uniref:Uncharacterized protein n=1 Tax=Venturia nashicola TaxID=86259 RepID=A0A4Z1PBU9_9PEZI|nr:hypothetical protein E6O75_ATG03948 [Venturia nashicola]TLD38181.1 hypothetical protein E2P81_ATG03856 [Venturia nashicola]
MDKENAENAVLISLNSPSYYLASSLSFLPSSRSIRSFRNPLNIGHLWITTAPVISGSQQHQSSLDHNSISHLCFTTASVISASHPRYILDQSLVQIPVCCVVREPDTMGWRGMVSPSSLLEAASQFMQPAATHKLGAAMALKAKDLVMQSHRSVPLSSHHTARRDRTGSRSYETVVREENAWLVGLSWWQ